MEWLYGNPEQGDSEALATWTSVRVSFTAPFLLFACMICFNFVIACRLYCFNVDVFVFGKKLLRAYVFCLYYMPNWNKVLLTYLPLWDYSWFHQLLKILLHLLRNLEKVSRLLEWNYGRCMHGILFVLHFTCRNWRYVNCS
jgi:hypothetical protein